MKKFISIVLTMVLLFSVFGFAAVNSAAADKPEAPVFSVTQQSTASGFLKLKFNLDSGIFHALDVKLNISQGLECTDIETSDACKVNGMAFTNANPAGDANHFTIVSYNGYSAPGAIFTATFKITNNRLNSYSVTFGIVECTVTVTTDGTVENVSVKPTNPVFDKDSLAISVVSLPKKTTYCIGEELNTDGLVVKAEYLDGSDKTINDYTLTSDLKSAGKKTVKISYTEGRFSATTSFDVTVNDHQLGAVNVVRKATCSAEGLKEQRCTVCDKVCHTEVIPATEHDFETITVNRPTFKADGESKTYCKICNHTKETTVLPKCSADIDGNGTVTSRDALEILQHATALKTLTGAALANADLDGSGAVNSSDALIVLQLATGLISA